MKSAAFYISTHVKHIGAHPFVLPSGKTVYIRAEEHDNCTDEEAMDKARCLAGESLMNTHEIEP
jgi:hypothetical protein